MSYNYVERWATKRDFPWMADLPTLETAVLEREKNDCLDVIVDACGYMRIHDYGPTEEYGWFECRHCGAHTGKQDHSRSCLASKAIERLKELGVRR